METAQPIKALALPPSPHTKRFLVLLPKEATISTAQVKAPTARAFPMTNSSHQLICSGWIRSGNHYLATIFFLTTSRVNELPAAFLRSSWTLC